MKNWGLLLIALLFHMGIYAQSDTYIPIRKGRLWGIVNTKGEFVLEPVYNQTMSTFRDYVITNQNGNYGLYNLNKRMFVFPEVAYSIRQTISPSNILYFFIYIKDSVSVLNQDGRKILHHKNQSAYLNFIDSSFVLSGGGSFKVFDNQCNMLYENKQFENGSRVGNFNWELETKDKDSILLLNKNFKTIDIVDTLIWKVVKFGDDFLIKLNRKNNKFYVWDLFRNKPVGDSSWENYSSRYQYINDLYRSFLKLYVDSETKYEYDFYNGTMKKLLPYDTVFYTRNGFTVLRHHKKFYLADSTSKIVIDKGFSNIEVLSSKLAGFEEFGKYAVYNHQTKKMGEYIFDDLEQQRYRFVICRKNGLMGLINQDGVQVTKCEYQDINIQDTYIDFTRAGKTISRTVNQAGQLLEVLRNVHHFKVKREKVEKLTWIDEDPSLPGGKFYRYRCYKCVKRLKWNGKKYKAEDVVSMNWIDYSRFLIDTCNLNCNLNFRYVDLGLNQFENSSVVPGITSLYNHVYIKRNLKVVEALQFKTKISTTILPILYSGDFKYSKAPVCVGSISKGTSFNNFNKNDRLLFLKTSVMKDVKWCFIDTNANVLIDKDFVYADMFNAKSAIVAIRNAKLINSALFGLINHAGETILPFEYSLIQNINDTTLRLINYCNDYKLMNPDFYFVKKETYEQMSNYGENKLGVCKNNMWTFIKMSGELLGKFEYKNVKPFSEGLAAVKLNKKWGFVDSSGSLVINAEFVHVDAFHKGKAFVKKNGGFHIIDKSGTQLNDRLFAHYYNFSQKYSFGKLHRKKFRIIDLNGNFVGKKRFHAIVVNFNDSGVAIVKKWRRRVILIDTLGKRLSHRYKKIQAFQDGLALIKKNGLYGYLNFKGDDKIRLQFKHASSYTNCRAVVYRHIVLSNLRKVSFWDIIDTSGNSITQTQQILNEQFSRKVKRDSLLKLKIFPYSEGMCLIQSAHKLFVIDIHGNIIDSIRFDVRISKLKNFKFQTALINNVHLLQIKDGKIDIYFSDPKFKYSYSIIDWNEKNIIIQNDLKLYGVWDRDLKFVLNCLYKKIEFNNNGFISIQRNRVEGLVENTGNVKVKCEFDSIEPIPDVSSYFYVREGYRMGCVDKDGKWVYFAD